MTGKYSLLFFALLFTMVNVQGQQTSWTLQQCLQRALDYNISIKQSALNNEINQVNIDQSSAAMFPSLNGSASQNYYNGKSIDPTTNNFTLQEVQSSAFSLSTSVSIFEGFQLQNSLKQSKLNYLSSKNDLQKIKDDVSLNVINFFLQILYNQELLVITRSQLDASKVQRDRTKRMNELGSISKSSYLDLESQYATDELRLIQAQAQYDQSILSLTQLLELDSVQNFTISAPEIIVPEPNAEQFNTNNIYAKALTTQPIIKSSEYKVLSSEKSLAIAKGSYYPRIFASGSVNTNYSSAGQTIVGYTQGTPLSTLTGYTASGEDVYTVTPNISPIIQDIPFNDQLDNNLGKSVGVTLQVPIFNGFTARSNVKRAQLNYQITQLNHEANKKALYKSVQQAVIDATSSYKKYVAGQRSVEALDESFKFNERSLELGGISTFDYLLSKNNYAKAQADFLQAKYDYIFRVKIIDFYEGKPLTF